MKKLIIILTLLLTIVLSGCEPANIKNTEVKKSSSDIIGNIVDKQFEIIQPTIYVIPGDGFSDINVDHQFVVINNYPEFISHFNFTGRMIYPILCYVGYADDYYRLRSAEFPRNKMAYLYQFNGINTYDYLFDDDTNYDEWFSNNKLIYCSLFASKSSYHIEANLKFTENKQTTLILENIFSGYLDVVARINFFVVIPNEYFNNFTVVMDHQTVKSFN